MLDWKIRRFGFLVNEERPRWTLKKEEVYSEHRTPCEDALRPRKDTAPRGDGLPPPRTPTPERPAREEEDPPGLHAKMLSALGRTQRLLATASLRQGLRPLSVQPEKKKIHLVDEHANTVIGMEPSRLPAPIQRVTTALRAKFLGDKGMDPELKLLLDKSSAQLYYSCANQIPYLKLCESFGLPDYMSSWFKLTLMHVWMVLLRLHVSLDSKAYLRLQRGLLATMWTDVDKRLEIVGEELKQTMTSKSDMGNMHGLHLQTFMEYDEGFLSDDRKLAAAVWRCLYMQREFDPVHLNRVVAYLRSTVAYLDHLTVDEILTDGIKDWHQLERRTTVV
uniref:Ubiq_cyt_C_chap domain-containing protein n=1 Tax=Steinernema glaseri TaxID=37863 RepID=A0A1I7YHJ9_9BILA